MKVRFPAETFVGADGNAVTTAFAIHNPDLTAVKGQPVKYWKLNGDLVEPMTAGERAIVDGTDATARKDSLAAEVDRAHPAIWRAFAEVVMDEINILRRRAALPDRTLAQLKTAMRNKLDG